MQSGALKNLLTKYVVSSYMYATIGIVIKVGFITDLISILL